MDREARVAVVVVPLPAQSHLSQLLHLSRLISAYGLPVHYVGSATHVRQVRDRVHGSDLDVNRNIHFHHLPLPSFAAPPPDPSSTTKFPAHLQPAFEAALHLEAPLASLLRSISAVARRVVVLHDSLMSFAARVAVSIPNAEAYSFHSISAFASVHFQWESRGKPPEPWTADLSLSKLSFDGCHTEEFLDFARRQHSMTEADSGRLFNTCRAIEGEFIDIQAQDPRWRGQKIFAVGPLNPVVLGEARCGSRERHACMEWLDKQPLASVVYVSFGTTSTWSDWQIAELAAGLEQSNQRFIWVLRDADRGNIYADTGNSPRRDAVPLDYEKRVEGFGMVVRDWAPQQEILAHPSTGGFMSHCGWNSCMESMTMGVPILAWPMHSDQPRNALLITQVLKVGIAVSDWADRDKVLPAAEVEEAIRRLMVGKEGKEVRKRAQEVGDALRQATAEGGTTRADLDSFIARITR